MVYYCKLTGKYYRQSMATDKGKTVTITCLHYCYISKLRILLNFLYIFDVAYMLVLKLFSFCLSWFKNNCGSLISTIGNMHILALRRQWLLNNHHENILCDNCMLAEVNPGGNYLHKFIIKQYIYLFIIPTNLPLQKELSVGQ
jgi:hypothetical protein